MSGQDELPDIWTREGGPRATGQVSADQALAFTLRQLRLREGMSLRDLVRRLGYSAHSAIADFESGRRLPSEGVIQDYETLFAVAPGLLSAQRRRVLAERADAEWAATSPRPSRRAVPLSRPRAVPAAQAARVPSHTKRLRSAALALADALGDQPDDRARGERCPGPAPDPTTGRTGGVEWTSSLHADPVEALALLLYTAMSYLTWLGVRDPASAEASPPRTDN